MTQYLVKGNRRNHLRKELYIFKEELMWDG